MANRAEQIVDELDRLTQELKDLSGGRSTPAWRQVEHIRVSMGFEKGGYVGQPSLGQLCEDGGFSGEEEEEEEE